MHDLKGLLKGIHQPLGPYGVEWAVGKRQRKYASLPICGGHICGLIWNLPMDLDYAANELGWPHWGNIESCCGWCPANRGEHSVRDVSQNCSWRALCFTPGPHDRRVSNHPLWDRGLGITRFTYTGDMMHGGDLGPVLHLHGNTIKELICAIGPFSFFTTESARLSHFLTLLWPAYREAGVTQKLQTVEVEMLTGSSGYPELSSKASESRYLVKVMLVILRKEGMHAGTEHDDHRLLCYEYLGELYDIIEAHGLFLPMVASDRLLVCVERFLLHYNWLAVEAMAAGRMIWAMVPKFHFLWHIAYFARFNSPSASWCYAFEDFVGKCRVLAWRVVSAPLCI